MFYSCLDILIIYKHTYYKINLLYKDDAIFLMAGLIWPNPLTLWKTVVETNKVSYLMWLIIYWTEYTVKSKCEVVLNS